MSLVEDAGREDHLLAGRPRIGVALNRLLERHFIEKIPATDKCDKPCKRCVVCCVPTGHKRRKGFAAPRRKETRYQCKSCLVALCVEPCFELYHTQTNYHQAYTDRFAEV